jgi:hypothetical protein
VYKVDRIRDGQSFCERFVRAIQEGNVIYFATVSYQKPEESLLAHQYDTMPEGQPEPETLPTTAQRYVVFGSQKSIPTCFLPLFVCLCLLVSVCIPLCICVPHVCSRVSYLASLEILVLLTHTSGTRNSCPVRGCRTRSERDWSDDCARTSPLISASPPQREDQALSTSRFRGSNHFSDRFAKKLSFLIDLLMHQSDGQTLPESIASCIAAFISDYSVGTTPLRSHPDINVCL